MDLNIYSSNRLYITSIRVKSNLLQVTIFILGCMLLENKELLLSVASLVQIAVPTTPQPLKNGK